jgi:hypothetical protein
VKTVLFWGDSHIGQLRPLAVTLKDAGVFGDRNVIFAASGGCPPARGINFSSGYHCASFTHFAETMSQDPSVDTVFYGFSAWFELGTSVLCRSSDDDVCQGPTSVKQTTDAVVSQIRRLGHDLAERHAHLIVMLPMPGYMVNPAEFEQRKAALLLLGLRDRAEAIDPVHYRNDFDATRATIRTAAQEAGATIYDPRPDLCTGRVCPYERDGVSLYTDSNHIAASQMSLLRPGAEAAFRAALQSPAPAPATDRTVRESAR